MPVANSESSWQRDPYRPERLRKYYLENPFLKTQKKRRLCLHYKHELLAVEENYLIILRIINTEKAGGRTSAYHNKCIYSKHCALRGLHFLQCGAICAHMPNMSDKGTFQEFLGFQAYLEKLLSS